MNAIKSADQVILFLSPDSFNSDLLIQETFFAFLEALERKTTFVLPIIVEPFDVIPDWLSDWLQKTRHGNITTLEKQEETSKTLLEAINFQYFPSIDMWKQYLTYITQQEIYSRWGTGSKTETFIHEELLPITVKRYDLLTGGIARKAEPIPFMKIALNPLQRRLLILGDPGTGKTTSLEKIMYEQAFSTLTGSLSELIKVPVILELKNYLSANKDLYQLFSLALAEGGIKVTDKIQSILSSKKFEFLIMIDGLNEIIDDDQKDLAQQIIEITRNHSQHRFFVTCRIRDYKAPLSNINWEGYRVEELNPEAIITYLDNAVKPNRNGLKIYQGLNKNIQGLIKNPQLLSMLASIYNEKKVTEINNRGQLYSHFISERFLWESNKEGASKSQFEEEEKRVAFGVIGFWHLYGEGEQKGGFEAFTRTKATDNWLKTRINQENISSDFPNWRKRIFDELFANALLQRVRLKGSQIYKFSHQSYQEFAVADYLQLLFDDSSLLENTPSLTRTNFSESRIGAEDESEYS